MCGIAGFWGKCAHADQVARAMGNKIAHRGPDSFGEWCDDAAGVALAHRRLSIIDLSQAGHQPMHSHDGRYVLTYNGEIYNHLAIRSEIAAAGGPQEWRGHSDTETLLAAISQFGLQGALERCNGMFAFALWDRKLHLLHLARDRMGEKPLYYGTQKGSFLFGSELKALMVHPHWQAAIDRNALTLFLRHNAVPAPYSIYQNIKKLPPAHYITVSGMGADISDPICYWSHEDAVTRGQAQPLQGDPAALTNQLEALLTDAVGLRMAADVQLGAFLSGGIDSSTVVALMQAQSPRPVRTFSIGFDEHGYNEAQHAKAVASHLGTEHTELYVRPDDVLALIPRLPEIWDEPFADSSQLPTLLVSQMARAHVTVSLSGDGGDELFCGYTRYSLAQKIWGKIGIIPRPIRAAIGSILARMPVQTLQNLNMLLPNGLRQTALSDRILKLAEVLAYPDGASFYRALVSHQKDPAALVLGGAEPPTLLTDRALWPAFSDLPSHMMYLDAKTYLPDDILTKVDRASMAVSLEARVPLLDHRLVEFAYALPLNMKLRSGQSKWLLRQVLYRHVPPSLMDRPKMGFGVPIEHWLRGPLREWGENLLNEKRLREEGFFNPAPIRDMWTQHQNGTRRWHYYLWDVLMFQAWLERAGT